MPFSILSWLCFLPKSTLPFDALILEKRVYVKVIEWMNTTPFNSLAFAHDHASAWIVSNRDVKEG
jgi:hypothetical protein